MSRPIQAQLPGLLNLLGLKNNGSNPPEMIDALAPTIDLRDLYLLGIRETLLGDQIAVDVSAVTAHFLNGFEVPNNEIWFVHSLTVLVNIPAGRHYVGAAASFDRGTQYVHTGPVIDMTDFGGIYTQPRVAWLPLQNFWATGGDLFGCLTYAWEGVGVADASARMVVSRLGV